MKIKHILMLLTVLLLCGSCATDDREVEQPQVAVSFTIASRAAGDDSASPEELINSWWIAVVDNEGIVCRIIERSASKTDAVESDEFQVNLAAGDYTVYAFANIDRTDFPYTIVLNQPMPDLSNVNWNKEVGVIGALVPMTGMKTVKVTQNTGVEIEVVRLWAKMRFRFSSNASQPVTVSKISMLPALTEAVKLLPDYQSLKQSPVLPEGIVCELLEHPTNLTVSKDGDSVDETFYLFESTAESHPTGHYPLSFELTVGGTKSTVSALAYQLDYINRNDFITIPVLITDWLVDVSVLFYPPIGGYPAVLIDKNGDEFYARFGSGGKFVICPTVSKADGSIVPDGNLDISLSTEDADGILSLTPAYDSTTSEIIGEIAAGKTGTAVVTLTIKVTDGELQYDIIRKFYIIRQSL